MVLDIESRNVKFGVFVMFLLLFSAFAMFSSKSVFADDPPVRDDAPSTEAEPSPSATSGTSSFPQCVGGDLERLEGTSIRRCLRFREQFERYAQQSGLRDMGVDTLFLFVTAAGESGCKSIAAGDEGASAGGILQSIHDCTSNPATNKCNTIDDEVRYGMEEFSGSLKRVISKGFSGRDAALMVLFAYNRGFGPVSMTKKLMDEQGKSIADAAQEACGHYYANYDAFPKRRNFCYDWVPNKYHCAGKKGDSVCDEGKTCSWWSGCFLDRENLPVPIHYSGSRWQNYENQCKQIGGHIVNEGAPLGLPPEAAKAFEEEAAAGAAPSFRMEHPYFSVPYSVNPSFSTSIPYDFAIYDTLPGYMHRIERCRANITCITENVELIEQEDPDFDWMVQYGGNIMTRDEGILEYSKWEAFCEEPDQHAVNSVAEALDVCSHSQDRDCICYYTLPVQGPAEEDDGGWFGAVVSAAADLLGISSFSLNAGEEWDERVISFTKSGRNVRVAMGTPSGARPQVVPGADFKEVASALRGGSLRELRYTPDDAWKVVHIYKDRNNNISIYPQFDAPSRDYCAVHDKMLKFCIIQNSSFFAYNQQQNRMGLQRMVLKFAYLFRSQVTDVRNFEIKDLRFASNASLLVWDPVDGFDVNFYTVYISDDPGMEANLRGKAPSELEQEIRDRLYARQPLQIDPASKQPIMMGLASVDNPMCTVYSGVGCTPVYSLTSVGEPPPPEMLYPESLYYSAVDRKLFYILPGVNNNQRYFFAITATNTNGEESPAFNIPESGKNSPSVDDLPPALAPVQGMLLDGNDVRIRILPVTRNIDESLMESPAAKYKVYCFDASVSGEFDLSQRQYAAYVTTEVSDPQLPIELSVSSDDFSAFVCGFTQTPQRAKVVVAGVKRVGGTDVDCGSQGFSCNVTEGAFSGSYVEIPEI